MTWNFTIGLDVCVQGWEVGTPSWTGWLLAGACVDVHPRDAQQVAGCFWVHRM